MDRYIVEGDGFALGEGAQVGLTADQIADRAHRVTVVEEHEDFSVVTLKNSMTFKRGDVIRLPQAPATRLAMAQVRSLDEPRDELEGDGGAFGDDAERARIGYVAKLIEDAKAAVSARGDVGYDAMTREQLDGLATERQIEIAGARNKGDVVALLQRADKVDDALAAGDFDALTIDELKWLAEEGGIDASSAKVKADYVALFETPAG